MTVTTRTILEWRYSSKPADFGHEGRPTRWRSAGPDATGTIRTIAPRIAEIKRDFGGMYYIEEYRVRGGAVLSREDLWDLEGMVAS